MPKTATSDLRVTVRFDSNMRERFDNLKRQIETRGYDVPTDSALIRMLLKTALGDDPTKYIVLEATNQLSSLIRAMTEYLLHQMQTNAQKLIAEALARQER